jgi:hypothetical protein
MLVLVMGYVLINDCPLNGVTGNHVIVVGDKIQQFFIVFGRNAVVAVVKDAGIRPGV